MFSFFNKEKNSHKPSIVINRKIKAKDHAFQSIAPMTMARNKIPVKVLVIIFFTIRYLK
jgi:hypothetical protein